MKTFFFLDKHYYCEDISLKELAKNVGTPSYVYSQAAISHRCIEFTNAFKSYPTLICYAVKANSNLSILRSIKEHGLGADIVSRGELERAIIGGFPGKKIVFSGVGKTAPEIERALAAGILFFNVESAFELKTISQVAGSLNLKAPVSLRINPNIDAKTNSKISTGLYSTKFGIPETDLPEILETIRNDPSLNLVGLACHIGSQITELLPLSNAAGRMADLTLDLRGQGYPLEFIDLGGGLGIRYQEEIPPTIEEYAKTLIASAKRTGLTLVIEPGRSIIGNSGILLTKVIGIKSSPCNNFVIIDAAMNDLVRPTLYEAYHEIVPLTLEEPIQSHTERVVCDFVGPVCESGDYIAKNRLFYRPKAGDLLAIQSCGAYGWSMASQYNSRPRPPEILVSGNNWFQIRPRETLESLWGPELDDLKRLFPNSGKI